jgi:epoxyqueuosine reductase
VAPGVLDARRCIAYWAQAPGVIPRNIREAWGDRLYGCDDCLDACPPGDRLRLAADEPRGRVDLITLLDADDADLLDTYQRFYVPRRQARYLRRNALVALGHTPGPVGRRVLAAYLRHEDPLLRLHAVWALAWGHQTDAAGILEDAAGAETDAAVLEEIVHSLRG